MTWFERGFVVVWLAIIAGADAGRGGDGSR
jgi:hypothetical protein